MNDYSRSIPSLLNFLLAALGTSTSNAHSHINLLIERVSIGNECEYKNKYNLFSFSKSCSTHLRKFQYAENTIWDEVHIWSPVLNEMLVLPLFLVEVLCMKRRKANAISFCQTHSFRYDFSM